MLPALIINHFQGGSYMNALTPENIKDFLLDSIRTLEANRDFFLKNPQKNFTRNRKISFEQTLLFPIIATNGTLSTEMLNFFPESNMPTVSAMIQQRNKLKDGVFSALFYDFTSKLPKIKKYHNLQLISCDGSHLNAPYNPKNEFTYTNCIKGRKGFNQYLLNAMFDVLNNVYLDAVVQGYHSMDENDAFCTMLKRNFSQHSFSSIFLLDRGYCAYNTIASVIHAGQYFVIRGKEPMIKKLLDDNVQNPSTDEVDTNVIINIGRRNTSQNRSLENFRFINIKGRYDFLPVHSSEVDELEVRIVKFKISDTNYEYILTNLPTSDFSISDIKALYRLRWNIETSFRELKYADGLVHFHSMKNNFSIDEIFAKLILHNFSSSVAALAEVKTRNSTKYVYTINRTKAIKLCIAYLKGKIKKILELMAKEKVPVRPNRKFVRNLRRQSADTLNNR